MTSISSMFKKGPCMTKGCRNAKVSITVDSDTKGTRLSVYIKCPACKINSHLSPEANKEYFQRHAKAIAKLRKLR